LTGNQVEKGQNDPLKISSGLLLTVVFSVSAEVMKILSLGMMEKCLLRTQE